MLIMTFIYMILPIIMFLILCTIKQPKVSRRIDAMILIVLFVINFGITYTQLPSRNVLSILLGNGLMGIIYSIVCYSLAELNIDDTDAIYRSKSWLVGTIICILTIVVSLGGEVYSKMSVKPTYNSIVKEYNKSTEAPTFKRNETPIALTPNTVLNRVRKSVSDVPNSQYFSVSKNIQAQYYKDKPVYIIPLQYDGFWAMTRAGGQIPGYFIIDATSQNAEPHFVKKPYKYAASAYFNYDVKRQIYRHNPSWLTMSDPQLEIDDKGTPYWIQTVYKSEAFSHRINYNKLHVVVMNAQTGKSNTYSLESLPKFIDEGITTDSAATMNKIFGKYKHGFWNQFFGKTDIIKPTDNGPENGVTSVFNRDGSISYFTDFTNPNNSSDSAMGYSMINARTGKLTFYKASGIMDSSGAKDNADQNYKAQHWKASMPILYNINNRPTWVMTILDNSQAIRGYYYLDAKDQSLYGTGINPTSALDSFRQALVSNNASASNTPGTKKQKINGTVDRIALITNKNKVMFTLQNSDVVYTVNTDDFDKANLLRTGDQVSFIATIVNGQSIGNVNEFKNDNLK